MVDGRVVLGDGPGEGCTEAPAPTLDADGILDKGFDELFQSGGGEEGETGVDTGLPAAAGVFDVDESKPGSPPRWELVAPSDNASPAPEARVGAEFVGEAGCGSELQDPAVRLLDRLLGPSSGIGDGAQCAALTDSPKLFSTPTRE